MKINLQRCRNVTNQTIIPVYTIGHGTRPAATLLALLNQYGIRYLADIRSKPFSRYNPQYNREALKTFLEDNGITYVFMGDTLGGRPPDISCYTNGRVDYNLVKDKIFFTSGIDRLVTAYQKQIPIAIMCSEANPAHCHRSKLIAPVLLEKSVLVQHINEAGVLLYQEDILREMDDGQQELF